MVTFEWFDIENIRGRSLAHVGHEVVVGQHYPLQIQGRSNLRWVYCYKVIKVSREKPEIAKFIITANYLIRDDNQTCRFISNGELKAEK